MASKSRIILGIDPGFAITGYGIVSIVGNRFKVHDYGCIRTHAGEQFTYRLKILHDSLTELIQKYKPDVVGVEELFFAKNVTTAIKVAQARGVILLTAMQANIPVYEFTPLQVKQSVSNYGRADKKQVQQMVKIMLNLPRMPQPDDAADALAVAICTANSKSIKEQV